ncbi:MAG: hypothetical protein V8Q30_13130 [Acutalibacteraceae bacterium]
MGSSIGVSGVWVLFSIIVGGSLFGVPGMVAGLPTFSVIYVLVRDQAHRRLLAKNRQINNPEEHLCEGDSCVLDDSVTEIFGKKPGTAPVVQFRTKVSGCLLCAVLCLGLLAGCTGTEEPSVSEPGSETVSQLPEESSQPAETEAESVRL